MTTNPHTLPIDFLECPSDCPFLGMRTFLPNTLPFYCNQYERFLGASVGQKIVRCARCRGTSQNIVAEGLDFINSYIGVPTQPTKEAFLKLDHHFQKMFVDLIARTGVQIVLETENPERPEALADIILQKWQEAQTKSGSPEMQAFEGLLGADGMPDISRQTKTLLMNLFQVMDNSEKEMMKGILQNPKQVESFLDQFEHQPQDKDLLKNVRALVYDYDRKAKESQRIQEHQQYVRQQQELAKLMRQNQIDKGYTR